MNPAMLAQAALAKRNKMAVGKANADDYTVEASGTRRAGDAAPTKKKEGHKNYMPMSSRGGGPPLPPKPRVEHRKDSMPSTKKKYGGYFPELDDQGKPIITFLTTEIIKKADSRALRLVQSDNELKVSMGCPFPCCAGVEEKYHAMSQPGVSMADMRSKLRTAKEGETNVDRLRRHQAPELTEEQKAEQKAAAEQSKKDAEIAAAWKEYKSPVGLKYYHNTITDETTYNVPEMFQRKKKKKATAFHKKSGNDGAAAGGTIWTEYIDVRTGKPYYSDGETTTWKKPPGFKNNA